MPAFRIDGTFTTASAVGAARKSFPFDGDNASFIVEQDFMVLFSSFSPLALDTVHPSIAAAYLVKESPLQDLGGGVARWTRTYAKIPSSRSEWSTITFNFPGYFGTRLPPYFQYYERIGDERDPWTATSVCRVLSEYFLCATGQTYETPQDIPIISRQLFTLDGRPDQPIDYLVNQTTNPLLSATEPTLPEYMALVAAEDEIVAEDSTIERWMGNIYERKTRYVIAK
jgi:hypothetical protein